MRRYPVYETFSSFQGEGTHAGRAAFFVRLYGCPIRCSWCDSAGTWHPSWKPKKRVQDLTAAEIVFRKTGPGFAVVTGGEPCIHPLAELVRSFHGISTQVHLETSGAVEIDDEGECDWVTVSPKRKRMPLISSLERANEVKLIIESPDDIPFFCNHIVGRGCFCIWLIPQWGRRKDPRITQAIVEKVKNNPGFRAGYQIHKLFGADQQDPNIQDPVPLGGVGNIY